MLSFKIVSKRHLLLFVFPLVVIFAASILYIWSKQSAFSELDVENIVVEFLKTTDVPNGGWDGTIEVQEIYDHKLGGKVVVAKYTTMNAGHPGFFLEGYVCIVCLGQLP